MNKVFNKILERLKEETDCPNCSMYCADANICGFEEMKKKAMSIVQEVAEEYNDDWIPCSERLPSDCAIHEVTAQFSNGKTYTEFAYYDEAREEWWKFDDDGLLNVIAWKESSETYQPKGE